MPTKKPKSKPRQPKRKAAHKPKGKPVSKKIVSHLEKAGVKFELVPHRKVYTAYDLAQTAGVKLDEIAKTLLVRVELPSLKKRGTYYVVVLPASYNLDLDKVKKALKATKVELVPEKVFKKLGLEPGAVSPFGSLRDFGVMVDRGILKAKQALVGAESFTESVRLRVTDLIKLEEATVAAFSRRNGLKVQKKPSVKAKKKAAVQSKKRLSAASTRSSASKKAVQAKKRPAVRGAVRKKK
ncbi:MAG: YbaK/EbsC family protein [bacterium]